MERIEGFRFLVLQAMDYDVDLQPQPFTLQDFREPLGIVEEIIKNGIEIWLAIILEFPFMNKSGARTYWHIANLFSDEVTALMNEGYQQGE